jgi:hypothetical protein
MEPTHRVCCATHWVARTYSRPPLISSLHGTPPAGSGARRHVAKHLAGHALHSPGGQNLVLLLDAFVRRSVSWSHFFPTPSCRGVCTGCFDSRDDTKNNNSVADRPRYEHVDISSCYALVMVNEYMHKASSRDRNNRIEFVAARRHGLLGPLCVAPRWSSFFLSNAYLSPRARDAHRVRWS